MGIKKLNRSSMMHPDVMSHQLKSVCSCFGCTSQVSSKVLFCIHIGVVSFHVSLFGNLSRTAQLAVDKDQTAVTSSFLQ